MSKKYKIRFTYRNYFILKKSILEYMKKETSQKSEW